MATTSGFDVNNVTLPHKSQVVKTKGTLPTFETSGSGKDAMYPHTMQLFGLPYQFLDTADTRIPGVSSTIGRKYAENIINGAPVLSIIPGKPKYLPGKSSKKKVSVTNALISAANGNFGNLTQLQADEDNIRLYDFQPAYRDCFQYINILIRSASGFLDAGGDRGYRVNKKTVDFNTFDWKNYRWDGSNYSTVSGSILKVASSSIASAAKEAAGKVSDAVKNKITTISGSKIKFDDPEVNKDPDELDRIEMDSLKQNCIQFYVDPDSAASSTSVSNNTQPSMLKQTFDGASQTAKELSFLMDSGGVDTESMQALGDKALDVISEGLGGGVSAINDGAGTLISRLLSSGRSVIRGENMIMPDIWSGCDMGASHTVTCHYKAPYGNKLCFLADVIAPVMTWISIAYPRATTANSYGSPFLVKAYMPGCWTVNLGIITQLEIKFENQEGSINTDGLFTECEVTATITDLYSDMTLTPANNPVLFANNASLVEFLATTCGLNLVESQIEKKYSNLFKNVTNTVSEAPKNAVGSFMEKADKFMNKFFFPI